MKLLKTVGCLLLWFSLSLGLSSCLTFESEVLATREAIQEQMENTPEKEQGLTKNYEEELKKIEARENLFNEEYEEYISDLKDLFKEEGGGFAKEVNLVESEQKAMAQSQKVLLDKMEAMRTRNREKEIGEKRKLAAKYRKDLKKINSKKHEYFKLRNRFDQVSDRLVQLENPKKQEKVSLILNKIQENISNLDEVKSQINLLRKKFLPRKSPKPVAP